MPDVLFAPWRYEYLVADKTGGCIFCEAAASADDGESLVVFRGERVFVILNRYPYNSGHLMVAPYEHTGDLVHFEKESAAELMHVTQRSVALLEQVYSPEAFNVGMNLGKPAGAGVPDHLHVHVVPRWNGDTNFMPVVAETKVLPESLEQTYERLAPLFRS